ncbi:heparinase II/III family protein [Prauserella cavernicola]|uniref:Alginate lyase family protein n=1 Tax=Prauserella cavernicola TaxID=2800127 RepID=A0A934V4Z9_9PSEU|nr:alginate lyase family protein [Prauserella cavernicola]MBK1784123.1 alginate lyase family protein [Prauserella cavernicola]
MTGAGWYLRRLSRMGPAELVSRVGDTARRRRWRRVLQAQVTTVWLPQRRFSATLPAAATASVPVPAARRLADSAERIMDGYADYFGLTRDDLVCPDWSLDPKTGRRAPADAYAFDVPYRDEEAIGDVKQLWEPSRHQHLTVLAAAYACTGRDRYAERVADHLKSWWAANPPMYGVHWVSGIELGIRLLSWVWVRRLLDGWQGAAELFEHNPVALHQIYWHQRWLATFRSRGSSANNHVLAEDAGRLAAACAFGWFPESARWRADSLRSLDEQLRRNTFGSGLNRELATEYHGLVLELGLAGATEASLAGLAVPPSTWRTLRSMTDALAAIVDSRLRPPRQGDADDGYGLVLDGEGRDRWASLLTTGEVLFGRLDWWPKIADADVFTALVGTLAAAPELTGERPARRPAHFADAGMTILRTPGESPDGEIWCRCDGGPHGFLSIAAHAHADALSLEVRHDGVDILADPGTYCYHGEGEWRTYFRSTLAHNTLELDGRDQSTSGGPFLWTRHASSQVLVVHTPRTGVARWCGEHDGYTRGNSPATHRRSVELDAHELRVFDEVLGSERHPCHLAFHLGPAVAVELDGSTAWLNWDGHSGERTAELELPPELTWTAHRGETNPPLGWYSPGFGVREPAVTLLGTGTTEPATGLATILRFDGEPR